jgi:hypothetical protein
MTGLLQESSERWRQRVVDALFPPREATGLLPESGTIGHAMA